MLNLLEECAADLQTLRHRLNGADLPGERELDESELPTPGEQAEHIAARLESCAGALRQAGGDDRNGGRGDS